jgi:hypothetical protein
VDTRGRFFFDSDLGLARTTPAPGLISFETTLSNGNRVQWAGYDPGTSSITLEQRDTRDSVLRKISVPYEMKPTVAIPTLRLTGVGPDAFWWLMSTEYHMELWGVDGKRRLTIERKAPWWVDPVGGKVAPDQAQAFGRVAAKHPMSSLNDLRVDDQEHLWVIARVPRRELPPSDTARNSAEGPLNHPYDRYDTMLEIFDARTGKLLVSERISGYLSHLLGKGHVAKLVDDEDGRPIVEIWKADLVGLQ